MNLLNIATEYAFFIVYGRVHRRRASFNASEIIPDLLKFLSVMSKDSYFIISSFVLLQTHVYNVKKDDICT